MSQNPFLRVRKEMGLTVAEFAAAVGLGSSTILLLEKGAILTPRIPLQKIAELGYDSEKLGQEYSAWRKELGDSIRSSMSFQKGA